MFKSPMRRLIHLGGSTLFLISFPALAIAARLASILRSKHKLPRVLFGTTPIISLRYWSEAVKKFGYESITLVSNVYSINSKSDFDFTFQDFPPHAKRLAFLQPFFILTWALFNFDIFVFFFDGGFLAKTRLRAIENQLLRAAGKKVIVTPYGSDIAVPEYLGVFREAFLESYPQLAENSEQTKERVSNLASSANFVIKNMQVGFLPRYDYLWPDCFAIDMDRWKDGSQSSVADGHNSEVVVVHSSNHRAIKGTSALIQAVDELRAEGLKVRLELLEQRSNEEVREVVSKCDILAEQFIGGYAMSAIEGMSAGKPVLSHLSWQGDIRKIMMLEQCPIVDTSMTQIKTNLRLLAEDPKLRRELGQAGREYVLKHHSFEAVGQRWDKIFRHLWFGEPLDDNRGKSFGTSRPSQSIESRQE